MQIAYIGVIGAILVCKSFTRDFNRKGVSELKSLIPLSLAFSQYNRKRKLSWIIRLIKDHRIESCLFVGAKANQGEYEFDNLIETGLAGVIPKVTASGMERTSSLWPAWVTADGKNLPFADLAFDLVFSNAVIEHVGDKSDQMLFISEHSRVGKNWIFTTPNRLFPIESHTRVIFLHMFRRWTHPDVTRLLSKTDIKEILPPGSVIKGHFLSPTFICYRLDNSITR